MPVNFPIQVFGGENQNDQEEILINKAYTVSQAGYLQQQPLESPSSKNMDFTQGGIRKRKGSEEYKDFTTAAGGLSIFAVADSDELISGIEWTDPATGNTIEVIVSKKTIYTNQSGTFAKINDASSNEYAHNSDVSKCTFAEVDGHLFIGLDGTGNYIQVYRSGADLDDPLRKAQTGIVDASSTSGAKIVYVSSTTPFAVGDNIIINAGKSDSEIHYVDAISAGVSITTVDNLTNTHSPFDWTSSTISASPVNVNLNGIVWGDGKFVAVGDDDGTRSYIITSSDGASWTQRTPTTTRAVDLNTVCRGSSYFVAGGDNNVTGPLVVTSPDGITWTEQTITTPVGAGTIFGSHYANGIYMVCGLMNSTSSNLLYKATDPTGTWTKLDPPVDRKIIDITYGNGRWVIVGAAIFSAGVYIAYSDDDGDTWTLSDNTFSTQLDSVDYGDGIFTAVGGASVNIITSTDGINWTEQTPPENVSLTSAKYFDGTWLACGYTGGTSNAAVWFGVDTINWYNSPDPQGFALLDIGFDDDDTWVCVGAANGTVPYVMYSGSPSKITSKNTYIEAFDTSTEHEITGIWDDATYLIEEFQGRLMMSTGNTLVTYTPEAYTSGSGIWNLLGSTAGFLQVAGNIRTITSFAPAMSDSLKQALYIGTDAGFEITTGVSANDILIRIEGAKSPLNHQSVAKTLNWLVYLTDDKNIMGINGANVIDLGRRLKSFDGGGTLGSMSVTDSATSAFGFYSRDKKQCFFFFYTAAANLNDTVAMIDFNLGEPVKGEHQTSFEQRVRCLTWDIDTPATNDWVSQIYQKVGAMIGIRNDGYLYTMESGNRDYASVTIGAEWESPVFDAGSNNRLKQWYRMSSRFQGDTIGAGTSTNQVDFDFFLNRETAAAVTDAVSLAVTAASILKDTTKLNRRSETIKIKLANDRNETFTVYGLNLLLDVGAEIIK